MADPLPTDGLSLIGLDSGGEPTVPGPWVFEMTVTLDHPRLRVRVFQMPLASNTHVM